MRAFSCDHCGQQVHFDDSVCSSCGSPVGYVHQLGDVIALTDVGDGWLVELGERTKEWQRCAAADRTACNRLVPEVGQLCESCVLTRERPVDGDGALLRLEADAEGAKRRLVHQLRELGLDLLPRDEEMGTGVAFDLVVGPRPSVVTGRDDGIITVDLAAGGEERRSQPGLGARELHRTLLGCLRHKIGHYLWPALINDQLTLKVCRRLFGDERADYGEAVRQRRVEHQPGPRWADEHVSAHATVHPYEDWAETFAYFLHVLDTLETASSLGIVEAEPTAPPEGFGAVVDRWLRLSRMLNEVNQALGGSDLFPSMLSPMVVRKLSFIDEVVQARRWGWMVGTGPLGHTSASDW